MMVFLYTDVPAYYTQLVECLMKMKKDVCYDLLVVIAHGTPKARCPAVELLFQYYPELNPSTQVINSISLISQINIKQLINRF